MRHPPSRKIASHGLHQFSGQELAQLGFIVAGKKLTYVFVDKAICQVTTQHALDRIRHVSRSAAIPNRTSDGLIQADRSAQAEVVGVYEAIPNFDLLAFD